MFLKPVEAWVATWARVRAVLRRGALLLVVGAASLTACAQGADTARTDSARRDFARTESVADIRAVAAPADTDDFGVALPDVSAGQRVVSLNPTTTEIFFALGEEGRLVGRSQWDEFPAAAKAVPSMGNGIKPNVEALLAARPTLVILYATPDNRAAADALERAGVRTLALRADRIAGFHQHVRVLGQVLGVPEKAQVLNDSVAASLRRVQDLVARHVPVNQRPTVLWPVWNTPPMVIGGGSYMDELLTIAGARNVFHDEAQPSPQVSIEEIVRRDPQRVVVSPERSRDLASSPVWQSVSAVREGRFVIIDPDLTGRPSVQLGMAASALARALHPALADSLR